MKPLKILVSLFAVSLFIFLPGVVQATKRCPKGKMLEKGKCIYRVCPEGMMRAKNRHCYCRGGYKWEKRKRYCVPLKCSKGMFRGSDERCYCPGNMNKIIYKGKKCCVPKKCPPNHEVDVSSGKCILKCPAGTIKPLGKNYCVSLKCLPGFKRDRKTRRCVALKCPSGKIIGKTGKCVSKKCVSPYVRNKNTMECELPPCPRGKIRPVGKKNCVRMVCPKGSKRDSSGRCECDSSSKWEPSGKYCVPRDCTSKGYRASDYRCYPCGKGKFRPAGASVCVRTKCPKFAVREKTTGKCVCPEGMSENSSGSRCVKSVCPEGHIRGKNGQCVCKSGFRLFGRGGYCVPIDCTEKAYRGKDGRCVNCPPGKFRPANSEKCFWKPCPGGKTRDISGKCPQKLKCGGEMRFSLDRKRCVPRKCPKGERRDPVTENCIGKGPKKRCKTGYHASKANICVPDECRYGQVRNSRGECVSRKCPSGWINKGNKCIKSVPSGNTRKICPSGTFLNPSGKCVPAPCRKGFVRPSDKLEVCLPLKGAYWKKCPRKGTVRTRIGTCVKRKKLSCPAGFRRIGNRCYF
ncbi:MAG: hypothetical protein JXR95_09055 [Deltaproteobacteria bacterium]|nr:hypothetical protein [Deltaproteobacteria bacterium]